MLAVPLGKITWDSYREFIVTQDARQVVRSILAKYDGVEVRVFELNFEGESIVLYLEVLSLGEGGVPDADEIALALSNLFDRQVRVFLDVREPIIASEGS